MSLFFSDKPEYSRGIPICASWSVYKKLKLTQKCVQQLTMNLYHLWRENTLAAKLVQMLFVGHLEVFDKMIL
jgi:hypothetical protein